MARRWPVRTAAVKWSLVTVASVFVVGTFYLILSPDLLLTPDPLNDAGENRSSSVACDDELWGDHRMAVVVPFRDRFDELLEFAPRLHRFLCTQRVRHQIFVINQADHFR